MKETEPETGISHNQKGTLIYLDEDVMSQNMLDLNEQKMTQVYGDWLVQQQNLKNIAKNDTLVQNLV